MNKLTHILFMRLFLLLTFCFVDLFALHAQRCPCSKNLDFTVSKMEQNYAGFKDKVTDLTRSNYQAHTDSMRAKAADIQSDSACMRLCFKWIRWFKDNHISMRPYGASQMLRGAQPAFAFSEIDSQTLLLTLPSMSGDYKPLVDSVLRANTQALNSKPYLIIDCRNNSGGSDQTWASLKPYLYTQPVVTDGRQYWASEDNAEFLLQMVKKEGTDKQTKKYLKKIAAEMKKRPGAFVGTMNARRDRPAAILPFPKKVIILVNKYSASSTENFLLWAKQSKKVTIMGRQTAGIADYGNAGVSVAPCRDWELWIPIMRSNRVADGRSLDNIGITPDVVLEENEPDLMARAREWMERK